MLYHSTRDATHKVSASEAIVQGLSREGGLYVPEMFPAYAPENAYGKTYAALAADILKLYLTDYEPAFLERACEEVYSNAFRGKAGHTIQVEPGMYSLELWHGPTSAFKDYALQLMPRLLVEAKRNLGNAEHTRILVATSGDTGKAALEGYKNLSGVDIAVFYPHGGVSDIQFLQMATQDGDNVSVYAVEGNFDDCQTGVKNVFANKEIAAQLNAEGICLSSANSINLGRLLPQIVYYFYAYAQLVQQGKIQAGDTVDYCVPTGNFGDILAGYYAKRMGLPVGRLICASNKNRILTDFFATGVYDVRREFYRTSSPSMDILVSSNLERMLYHFSESTELVASFMQNLKAEGVYQIPAQLLEKIDAVFVGGCADEQQTAAEILRLYQRDGYLSDTHTAVAFSVAEKCRRPLVPMVVLSTASPFKFSSSVLAGLQQPVPEQDFAAMEKLAAYTGFAAPENLRQLQNREVRFTKVISIAQIANAALGTV